MIFGPVSWCRDGLLVAKLQSLYATDDLRHVATHACWVVETQHELVVGVDDKDASVLQQANLSVSHFVIFASGRRNNTR